MEKSRQIRVLLLGIVYSFMLTAFVMPHHHHEEVACYTSTHCDENTTDHKQQAEEPLNHHHDNSPAEEGQHCISIEYYVYSVAGKNLKRVHALDLPFVDQIHFLIAGLDCAKEEPELMAKDKLFRLLSGNNDYIVIVKNELPLRAPPSNHT